MLRQAMLATVAQLNSYTQAVGAKEPSLLNFCVSDGQSVVATRYISSKTEAVSIEYLIIVLHRLSLSSGRLTVLLDWVHL